MKEGDYIKFGYKGKIEDGVLVRIIEGPLHASSCVVAIGAKLIKVMGSEVVK